MGRWKKRISLRAIYAHFRVASRIGPGTEMKGLHRDNYIHQNTHDKLPGPWDGERGIRKLQLGYLCQA
ncbi:hypothetical protein BGZ60DRAFT_397471 [Tricladium varicosporioides]|nr:hypothetical protein BGZ60DRAFT_397471 [Hymenoscyphus varicosporioides]